jgi:thermitase
LRSTNFLALSCLLTLAACQSQISVLRTSSQRPTGTVVALGNQTLDDVAEAIVTYKAGDQDVVDVDAAGLSGVSGAGDSRTQVLRFPSTAAMRAFLASVKDDPRFESVGPNALVKALGEPNDRLFPDLWGHRQIKAPAAWDTAKGSPGVIVAVIDTGVDHTHPDLTGDTVLPGGDFVDQDDDAMDDHGHGTHVAGTIAAMGENGIGIAGVAHGVKVLAIKALDRNGYGRVSDIADAIARAQKLGAKVIALAFGTPQSSPEVGAAVAKASADGVLVVAPAGNDNAQACYFPAAFHGAFAVGATDTTDGRAWFSNYGPRIDIAAPGVAIHSSVLHASYEPWNGTSMSVPYVAGAAALLWSRNATLSMETVRAVLIKTGDPTRGFGSTAVKRVNLGRAITTIPAGPTPSPTPTPLPQPPGIRSYRLTNPAPGTLTMDWETERPGDSRLQHGAMDTVDQTTAGAPGPTLRHSATVTGVPAETPYYLRAASSNEVGESRTSTLRVFLRAWATPTATPPALVQTPAATPLPPAPTPVPVAVSGGGGGGGGAATADTTLVAITPAQLAVAPGGTVTATVTVRYPDGTSDHDVSLTPASPFSRGTYTYDPVTGQLQVTLASTGDGSVSTLTFTARANRAVQASASLVVTMQKSVQVRVY